jgi:hypothetical protein
MLRRILAFLLLTNFYSGFIYAEGEAWDPSSAGPVTSWTAPLCGKGKFVVQPFFFYNRARGSFDSKGKYSFLAQGDKKYQYQEQLFAQYGITDRLEIDGQMVYQENYTKLNGVSAHASGLGDSYAFLRYCFLEEEGWKPLIAGLFQLKIPTGKYQHEDSSRLGTDLMGATSGGGSWDHGLGVILTKHLKPFILHADVLYSIPQSVKVNGTSTRYADYVNVDVGVEYFLAKGFNLMFEVNGFFQGDRKEAGLKTTDTDIHTVTLSPGIGWSDDKIQFLLAYQRVVSGVNADANDSAVLTCVYTF